MLAELLILAATFGAAPPPPAVEPDVQIFDPIVGSVEAGAGPLPSPGPGVVWGDCVVRVDVVDGQEFTSTVCSPVAGFAETMSDEPSARLAG